MSDRSAYFREYRKKNREKLVRRSKAWYKKNKTKALTYRRNRYILKKDMILAKAKGKSFEFLGHTGAIHRPVKKYAKKWKLPFSEYQEFKTWAMSDPGYETLFNAWKESGFSKNLSPVVIRTIKKKGFVVDNLTWRVKGDFGWWSEEQEIREEMEKELDAEQRATNKGTKEEQAAAKKAWKEFNKKK